MSKEMEKPKNVEITQLQLRITKGLKRRIEKAARQATSDRGHEVSYNQLCVEILNNNIKG